LTITVYHNPKCGTSRNVLAMIRERGVEPVVIEYLKNPPTRERLQALIAAMGINARALMRRKEAPYAALGLDDPRRSEDEILDAMVANPILIERPIVVAPKGVRLCRPKEAVLDILP
jgi:arsenate reductase